MLELCRCPNIYGPDCIYIHTHTHILYMELMKLQEIPNMDNSIAIPVTE